MKLTIVVLATALTGCASFTPQDFDNGLDIARGLLNARGQVQQGIPVQNVQLYQFVPSPNACIQDGGTIFCKR